MSEMFSSKVLLPLYIYPQLGAWDPLYTALSNHPHLDFYIIINPDNGPGSGSWWSNSGYMRELPRLNAFPHATTLGYVNATYCERSLQAVTADIGTYAERMSNDPGSSGDKGLGLKGIFVDETVNLYSVKAKGWLDAVDRQIKTCGAFGDDAMVIHNPGTAVEAKLAQPGPDVTVVVETSYEQFVTEEYQQWLATSPYDRSRSCYMLYAVPEEEIESLTRSLRERAGFLFLTSATTGFYENWDSSWETFVATMAE